MAPASLVITTSLRAGPELLARAEEFSRWLDAPVVSRPGSLAALCAEHGVQGVLVVGGNRVTYHEPGSGLQYFYHPGMVKVRLHSQKRGDPDPMITAMGLGPGDSVLDCTLGRASDGIFCSWIVGETGRVLGLEVSPVLAALTRDAIAHHTDPSRSLTAALRRIECECADYNDYLRTCAPCSWDVVYFDPIFHEPLATSPAMEPLRALGDPAPLSPAAVQEACRVARRRVVIKQRKGTPLWAELGLTEFVSSPKSPVEYGVIAV